MRTPAQYMIPAVILLALGACQKDQDQQSNSVGLANPAATFCQEEGGDYSLSDGQCLLADGSSVDAWWFFKHQVATSTETLLPNPAAEFCNENGDYDLASGECQLADGSQVDAWDYFREQHQVE